MATNNSGCRTRVPQFLVIIIIATVLAAALFLLLPYIQNRPDYPRGTFPVYAEGNQIMIVMDPNREVMLVTSGDQGVIIGTGGPGTIVELATATPAILPTVGPTATIPTLPTVGPTPIPQANCVMFISYTVQSGDTLYSISNKYITSIPLMAANGISSVTLVPGNTIQLPVGNPNCCSAGWQPYAVMEGDTWFGIAQKCGVSVETIYQGNGVGPGAPLYMTSIICVPQN